MQKPQTKGTLKPDERLMNTLERARCQVCRHVFNLDEQQQVFVKAMKDKGQPFMMIECPHCGTSTQYVDSRDIQVSPQEQSGAYRCPVAQCSGWVEWIADTPAFLGCGECGSQWYHEAALQREISQIVARYAYRAACYEKTHTAWAPAPLEQHPEDYEARVEQEAMDTGTEQVRG